MNTAREDQRRPAPGWSAAGIDNGEAGRDANLLARHVLGWDRATVLHARRRRRRRPDFIERFDPLIERRARREPVAYIRGDAGILEPRFRRQSGGADSAARNRADHRGAARRGCPSTLPAPPRRVADIGTGSGCLAVTRRRRAAATSQVIATDISRPALDVARANAGRHGVVRSDRVRGVAPTSSAPTGPFDFILSNPPYVTESRVPEPRAGSARVRAGARRWWPARTAFATSGRSSTSAPRSWRPAARCSSRSATSRRTRWPTW